MLARVSFLLLVAAVWLVTSGPVPLAAQSSSQRASEQRVATGGETPEQRVPTAGETSEQRVPTRGELLEAERAAKAQADAEHRPPVAARVLGVVGTAVEFVGYAQDGWQGFHFDTGDFPSGAGFPYGVAFTDRAVGSEYDGPELANRLEVSLGVAGSTRGYEQISGEVTLHNILDLPLHAGVRGVAYEHPQEDFFGLGSDSVEGNRTTYLLRSREVDVDVWWDVWRLRLGSGIGYADPRVESGTDERFPSAEQVFAASTIPALAAQPEFGRLRGWLDLDLRDNPEYPRSGAYLLLEHTEFRDLDFDAFDFRRTEVDVHYYVPITQGYRVIALRTQVVLTDPRDGHAVPFFLQPTLGGNSSLRGFREFRFRDRNSLLMTAEYRWQAGRIVDPALFVDVGKVVPRRSEIDLTDLDVSYGFGLRFHTAQRFVLRLDLAKSREGFIPFLRFDHVF